MFGSRELSGVNKRRKYDQRKPRLAGILLGIGVDIALAVALDNVAIGIGVGFVYVAGSIVRATRKVEKKKKNEEEEEK
jgi:hypothetical protein